ncbi:MAG: phospho-N-acetylmuramoyl-pentapeptide-transferase [Candidatus Berkelbacteria bacterium]
MDKIEMIVLYKNDFIRFFWLTGLSFLIAMIWTPLLTNFLYKYKLGKRIRLDKNTPIFSKLHAHKSGTPTMGGILVWVTTAVLTIIFNLERSATWLPLFSLVAAGIIGGIDDMLNIYGIGARGGGMRFREKFLLYAAIAAVGAWWFYYKLGWNSIHIPAFGDYTIGAWYIPLFIIALVWAAFASNEADGLDGLAGGIFALSYGAYAILCLSQGKIGLALFCGTVMGALLAFLWFNINPARFFMGDTGSMALGITLGVIAFLTNSIVVFPIITLIFTIEGLSFLIQRFWKIVFKRKLFLSSPIHHHFEAIGWPEQKIVMRFWVIGAASTMIGLAIALFGHGF